MLKLNETVLENVKFNGVDLDKVIVNGIVVFEKSQFNNTVTMRTLQDSIKIFLQTKDSSSCEVYNDGNKIGVLRDNRMTNIFVPNKNEAVIITKGENITSLYCPHNQLTSLNIQGLNNLEGLDCYYNYLINLNLQGTALQYLHCSNNNLMSLNIQGLNSLKNFNCFSNRLNAQAFKEIFNNLLQTADGKAIVYYYNNDDNYKDFTHPPELLEAFNGAKSRGWKFYKDYVSDSNLI